MALRYTRREQAPVGSLSGPFEAVDWTRYELDYDRREAQAEADIAYRAWSRAPASDGFAVYRAAQDRADAAQDALADWSRANCRSGDSWNK